MQADNEGRPFMLAALRPILVTLATLARHVGWLVSPRRLAEQTILRSKHWPSDGLARHAFLAAASISALALTFVAFATPDKFVWN